MYNSSIKQVNGEELDDSGIIVRNKLLITCQQHFLYSIMFVVGPWLLKFKYLFKLFFFKIGFDSFSRSRISEKEEKLIDKCFHFSIFCQTFFFSIPHLILNVVISENFEYWS